jgi:hypothetical protein
MRTRPIAVALLLSLAPAITANPVLAQSASEDPTTAMARARFKEGVEFYDKAQYEQARAAFVQAYALKKHPAVLLNLAWSCLKSGHALEAEKYFRQFLTEGKDITEKQRADANDGLNQSRGKIGRIEVVAPAGTEVTIDGDRAGTAPLGDPLPVEPGAHTLTFKGPDSATETQSVTVLGGEKTVARFGRGTSSPASGPPSPPPAPPASTEATSAASNPPPEEAPHPHERPATKEAPPSHGKDLLSPPANLTPVIIGGVLTVAGVGVAVAMSIFKSSAQNQANLTAESVKSTRGLACPPSMSDPAVLAMNPTFAQNLPGVCDQYTNDINDVNTDATIGNIALGVGIAAFAGTVIYWLAGDKGDDSGPRSSGSSKPVVVPTVGNNSGGLSVGGRF